MSESFSVVVDNLGYVFGNFTIGPKRPTFLDSSDSEDEPEQKKQQIETITISDDSEDEGPIPAKFSKKGVRKTHTDKFKETLENRTEHIMTKILEFHNQVASAQTKKGFFEIAISRMLYFWQSLSHQVDKTNYIRYIINCDNKIGRIKIYEDGSKKKFDWAKLNKKKRYYVSVYRPENAHAVVLFADKDETWHLFDPNGNTSDYALIVQKQAADAGVTIQIMDTQNVHGRIFKTDVFLLGMAKSRSMGWCALWALFVLRLLNEGCSREEILNFMRNQYSNDDNDILLALRDSVVHFFREVCLLFLDENEINEHFDDNYERVDIFEKWQTAVLGNMLDEPKEQKERFKMWGEIFQKSPNTKKIYKSGEEDSDKFYSIAPPKGDGEYDFPIVKMGSQKWNKSHMLPGYGVYVLFEASRGMVNYKIGLHMHYREDKTLWGAIKDTLNMKDIPFGRHNVEIKDVTMYSDEGFYTQKDKENQNKGENLFEGFPQLYYLNAVYDTGDLLVPMKSKDEHRIVDKFKYDGILKDEMSEFMGNVVVFENYTKVYKPWFPKYHGRKEQETEAHYNERQKRDHPDAFLTYQQSQSIPKNANESQKEYLKRITNGVELNVTITCIQNYDIKLKESLRFSVNRLSKWKDIKGYVKQVLTKSPRMIKIHSVLGKGATYNITFKVAVDNGPNTEYLELRGHTISTVGTLANEVLKACDRALKKI